MKIQELKAMGMLPKRPRRRIPRQQRPAAIERDYARALIQIAKRTTTALEPLMVELPALLRSARAEILRTDASLRLDAGESQRMRQLISEALARTQLTDASLEGVARQFAARVQTHQRIQMARQVHSALGVDVFVGDSRLVSVTEAFTAENIALIKNLPVKTLAEIEGIVTRGVTGGSLHADIAKEIRAKLGMGESRAKLIARDQVGKFYGNVTATRHQSIGIDKFIWNTVGDERVREEHSSIHGEVFKYSEGGHPQEGIPGQPILCRCFPEPVFEF